MVYPPPPALSPVLLVARSAGQIPATLATLHTAGYTNTIGIPVSITNPVSFRTPENTTALILTSPNTLVNPQVQALTHLPVYAVGPATAEAAANLGFTISYIGSTDATDMARTLAAQKLPPQNFLHPHASNAGTGWYQTLEAAGHTMSGCTAYLTTPADTIDAAMLSQIQQTPPTHALVFSRGGATSLKNLLTSHQLVWPTQTVAISAQAVMGLTGRISIAPSPNLPSMLICLP